MKLLITSTSQSIYIYNNAKIVERGGKTLMLLFSLDTKRRHKTAFTKMVFPLLKILQDGACKVLQCFFALSLIAPVSLRRSIKIHVPSSCFPFPCSILGEELSFMLRRRGKSLKFRIKDESIRHRSWSRRCDAAHSFHYYCKSVTQIRTCMIATTAASRKCIVDCKQSSMTWDETRGIRWALFNL